MKICIVTLLYILVFAISWAATVGIVKLITLCFKWDFSIAIATGIWLIMFILKSVFSRSK